MASINFNIAGRVGVRYVNLNSARQTQLLAQLSSGKRVNAAKDDAANLAISTRIRSDSMALAQAGLNAQTGLAVLKTADGGLAQIEKILLRMKQITSAAQAGTLDASAFTNLNLEYQQLFTEIGSVAAQTRFNNVALLDGTGAANTFSNVSGADVLLGTRIADVVTISTSGAGVGNNATAAGLAVVNTAITTAAIANTNALAIDAGLQTLAGLRATNGAQTSRFEFRAELIAVQKENTDAATDALLGADAALVQTDFSVADVLAQSAIAALQKANAIPQQLLRLLQS